MYMYNRQRPLVHALSLPLFQTTEVTTSPVDTAEDSDEGVFAMPTMIPDHSGKRRRGRKPEDEDPEIKRQRFLERNRYVYTLVGTAFRTD